MTVLKSVPKIPADGINLPETIKRIEREWVMQALERCDGNKSGAARLLGIRRTTLLMKLRAMKPHAKMGITVANSSEPERKDKL